MPPCDGFAGRNPTERLLPRVGFLAILAILGLPEKGFQQKWQKMSKSEQKWSFWVSERRVRIKAGLSAFNGKSGSQSGPEVGPEVVQE